MVDLRQQEPIEETVRYLESLFEDVAHQYDPGELALPLRDLVAELISAGYPREVVQGSLDDYRYLLRRTGREDYEDDVFDVVDFITGWCSPHLRIDSDHIEDVPEERESLPVGVKGRRQRTRAQGARATKKKPVHVTPRDDGWAVIREGNQRASSVHHTQKEAEKVGREAARKDKTEFFLHSRQGQIRKRDSYGSDPRPSKG